MDVNRSFFQVLLQERELLAQLIALGEEKRGLMLQPKQLQACAAQEQRVLLQLEQVERERCQLFDVLAPGQTFAEWLITAPADLLDETGLTVHDVATELQGQLQRLRELHTLNEQLLQESLHFVQMSLSLLVEDGPSTYAREGAQRQNSRLLDFRA